MKNEVIIPELLGWTTVPVEIRILSLRKEAIYREIVREQGMTALPGVGPPSRSLTASVMGSATKASLTSTSFDPVPRSPVAFQVSIIL